MSSVVTLDQVRAAAEAIRPFIYTTPLVPARELSDLSGARVYLKAESLQVTGSFKLRAALNETLTLPSIETKGGIKGVVAASSGNFAQALAWAGSRLNIPVTIVMEQRSSPLKVARTREYGAEVLKPRSKLKGDTPLIRIEKFKAVEGIASNVRQARTITVSSDAPSTDSYECLFRISGKPVALRVNGPIFIEDGETVTVIGMYNQDGVFEASAYYNQSSGVSGLPEMIWSQWRGIILAGVGSVLLLFLVVGKLAVSSDDNLVGDLLFLLLLVLIGLVIIWGVVMFVQFRIKIRAIERLLNAA